MFTENLFEHALIEPVRSGLNRLLIVTGYATSAMAFHHLQRIKDLGCSIKLELIIGMCPADGISESNHAGFNALVNEGFRDRFICSYVTQGPAVHSKVYAWCKDDIPQDGLIGSANYTQFSFYTKRREVLGKCDAQDAYNYFQSLVPDTIYCNHEDVGNNVRIFREIPDNRGGSHHEADREGNSCLPAVNISLLDRSGELPQRSGLNWGQRPELGREPNQAYIRIPARIQQTDFFPERKIHFTVLTDDGKVLICTRAQDNGKAIHTPHNNSLIGEYFRNRLGVASGESVEKEDLLRYGRTDITFQKIDQETYYLDFSV